MISDSARSALSVFDTSAEKQKQNVNFIYAMVWEKTFSRVKKIILTPIDRFIS